MRRTTIVYVGVMAACLAAARPVLAQNRVEQQVFLDLRNVQEQNQRLQLVVNSLIEQLKTVTAKLDAEANARNKGFADQQAQVSGVSSTLSALQANVRDSKVEVQKLSQETEAVKKGVDMLTTLVTQALAQMPAAPPPVDPNAPPGSMPPAPQGATGVPPTAKDYYDRAYGDYMTGQYPMAIEGFAEVVKRFPASPSAADAQFQIGQSYYQIGKYKEAVAAYELLIKNYPDNDNTPDAYYKQGLCYDQLKQRDLMIKNYQIVREKYPDSAAAVQATLVLKGLGVIK